MSPGSFCFSRVLFVLSIVAATAPLGAGEKLEPPEIEIVMAEVIPFAPGEDGEIGATMERIQERCDLGRELARSISSLARRKKIPVVTTSAIESVRGKVLLMEIEGVFGRRGGAITGTKSVTVRGELLDGGSVIGSFVARRQQTALTSSTCRSLVHCARAIAKDIVGWLNRPTMKARLGSA